MEEVLNQEQTEITDGDDLFSDVVLEETPEEPTKEVEETKVEEPETPVETKPFLEIQYNKELKGLSQEEAKTLAQKGMNYDKMADKYNSLEGELEKLASVNGMSVKDYIGKLQEMQGEMEVEKEFETLKDQYPNAEEEILRQLAKERASNNAQASQVRKQKELDDAREADVKRQIEEFKSVYPDVNPDDIPDEVVQMVQEGKSLLGSYVLWNKSQEAKNSEDKIAKQNEENKKRSLGNTTNAGSEEPDDFFSGFNSI